MTVTASAYARRKNDLYPTEPWATEALLKHFPMTGLTVWEPAAGNHLMADVLRDHGARVITSDIVEYDRPHTFLWDFLKGMDYSIPDADECNIITNPPYGPQNIDATRFARLALERCKGTVALLLTAKFDFGKTRNDLFRDNARFTAKITLTDRLSWTLDDETGTEDHAWYVWTENGPGYHPYKPFILYEGLPAPRRKAKTAPAPTLI